VLGFAATPVGFLSEDEIPDAPIAAEPPKGMLASKEGGGAAILGGYSVWEIWDRAKDYLSPDSLMQALQDPHVRPWLIVGGLAGLIWYWRYRRMHYEDG
jgi:hypothetical protein